jgi:hypothetical protein
MPTIQTAVCPRDGQYGTDHVEEGDLVRAGRMGAAWRVLGKAYRGPQIEFVLTPVDAHDVPLAEAPMELPLPGPVAA